MLRKPPKGLPPSQRKASIAPPATRKRSGHGSDESCETNSPRAIAYHEAGHAVAALLTGVGLFSADIEGHQTLSRGPTLLGLMGAVPASRRYLGFTRYTSGDGHDMLRLAITDPDYARRLMLVTSAGPSSEAAVLRDEGSQEGYDEDNERLTQLAAVALGFGTLQPDGRIRVRIPNQNRGREVRKIQTNMEECFAFTEVFLRDHWPAVKAVAMELLDKKSLTVTEVAEIVRASGFEAPQGQ